MPPNMIDSVRYEYLQMIDDLSDRIHHDLYDFHLEVFADFNGVETDAQTLARQEICEDLSISICGSLLERQTDPTLERPIFYEALRRYKVWCSESLWRVMLKQVRLRSQHLLS